MVAACGGGGGGGGSTSSGGGGGVVPPPQTKTPPPPIAMAHFGVALFGDDGHSTGVMQMATLFDSSGTPVANPSPLQIPFPYMFDLEDIAISPDGSTGLVADGARTLRVFRGVSGGAPSVSSTILDLTAQGNDLDSVRILQNGDEAVLTMDTAKQVVAVSGLLAGQPKVAQVVATPDLRNGLVLSADNTVLLARGYSGVTVFAVAPVSPVQGPGGGWIYHSFTQTQNLTAVPPLDSADSRAGMASDPADSSRAIVVGMGPALTEITGLPASPAASAAIPIAGSHSAFAVDIAPDGSAAYVATDNGIAVFNNLASGTPKQIQTDTIAVAGGDSLVQVTAVTVTHDGKYVVALGHSALAPNATTGYLVVLPITSSGLGAPVTTVPNVLIPDNDQLVVQ